MKTTQLHCPVFVTGVERSGSSLVARILNLCGAFSGKTSVMMENLQVKALLDDYYVNYVGSPSNGQFPMPDINHLPPCPNWSDKVTNMLQLEGAKDPWLYKSPRIAQTWILWHVHFPQAKWIIVRRRTGDIVQSCLKTGYMTSFRFPQAQQEVGASSEEEAWKWWVREQQSRFQEIVNIGVDHRIVWPERMAYGDYDQIQEVVEWLGLTWREEIKDIIDPLLVNSVQRTFKKEGV